MTRIAGAVLAAITLAGPTLAIAAGKPTGAGSQPSSYAPRPHATQHIYGSPIGPPIAGHATASHHAHRKHSTHATARNARQAPAHSVEARGYGHALDTQPGPR
jgi:hypothetical protein